ncbi:hypothetical protein SAMN05421539_102633 [Jannaschia seohaensis]|uniref:Uncharacterized protein n=1 Tax=Jannaschia seohaensis TaxID=475081 RepID=A0A2Y9ADI7_9RHOB|nr:hypothetical protein BCF38_102633 [Jannaschia seohaensis]SSA41986.1 hypothetical protein SAMN05421539_102633 [Jannaschia seohaensis]
MWFWRSKTRPAKQKAGGERVSSTADGSANDRFDLRLVELTFARQHFHCFPIHGF